MGSGPGPKGGPSEHHLFGKPLDPALLAEAEPPPARPFPKRPLAAVLVPLAALAAAAGLQRALEGPVPEGDAALRWLCWSAGLGLPLGALAGLSISRTLGGRLFWAAWGLVTPFVIAGLVLAGVGAARPVREWAARRGEAKCRLTRKACTSVEFRDACIAAAAPAPGARERATALLGAPQQELCGPGGCTLRWLYTGPWRPDDWMAPGSMLCSVVTDAEGKGVRHALNPGTEPKD